MILMFAHFCVGYTPVSVITGGLLWSLCLHTSVLATHLFQREPWLLNCRFVSVVCLCL